MITLVQYIKTVPRIGRTQFLLAVLLKEEGTYLLNNSLSQKNEEFVVALTTLTYGGETLGRLPDGRAVFVPFALPGERVKIRLYEQKKRYARGKLIEVLDPSSERIDPFCRHFTLCGGCHYQNISYQNQLKVKREILIDQLLRNGGIQSPPIEDMVPSPRIRNYRNYIQFHLTSRGELGFYKFHSDKVFPVKQCYLPEESINSLWPQLDFESFPELENIGVRRGSDDDLQIILKSNQPETPELSVEDLSVSVVHVSPFGSLVLAGSEYVFFEVLGRHFRVSAASFFQVNTEMAALIVEHLLNVLPEYVPITSSTTLVDVYCGVGLFSAFFADRIGHCIGVESSSSAAEDFVFNLDEFDNVDLYEASAEDVLPHLDAQPHVMVLDPPRAGIDRRALDAIVSLSPNVIAYVSCNPATLARDGARLIKGGYHLVKITPFDLFPHTYHIESISFWLKKNA